MVPVSVIATNICLNFGDSDRKYFGEHMVNIIEVYKFMHIYLMDDVSAQSIILNAENISSLPCDFVRETKVGIINKSGRIATMSIDKNLRVAPTCKTRADVELALCSIDDGSCAPDCFSFYNTYDPARNYIGEQRGYACALNDLGYFNIDRKKQILTCDPANLPEGESIIMEYISDGISAGLELVPVELVDCITKACKSRYCLDKGDNRWQAFEQQYQVAYKNVKTLCRARKISVYAQLFKTLI